MDGLVKKIVRSPGPLGVRAAQAHFGAGNRTPVGISRDGSIEEIGTGSVQTEGTFEHLRRAVYSEPLRTGTDGCVDDVAGQPTENEPALAGPNTQGIPLGKAGADSGGPRRKTAQGDLDSKRCRTGAGAILDGNAGECDGYGPEQFASSLWYARGCKRGRCERDRDGGQYSSTGHAFRTDGSGGERVSTGGRSANGRIARRMTSRTLCLLAWTLASPMDAEDAGERVYNVHCAPCHGIGGTGGRGPGLARLSRVRDEAGLLELIRAGIPGTEMPRGWMLSERELGDVTKYVRSLGTVPPSAIPGDAARGAALFRAKGCGGCHIVRGAGEAYGPELTEIGARRSAAHLRESVTKPGATVPEGFMMVTTGSETGIRIAEDTFTVQILFPGGRIGSYRKANLPGYARRKGETPMPPYGLLAAAEVDDLVAYLASLRGESR